MAKTPRHIKLSAFSILLLLVLGISELLLRLLGFQPYEPIITTVFSTPKNALIPHKQYGLAMNPGDYTIQLNQALKYQASHLPDSSRNCGVAFKPSDFRDTIYPPIMHTYGCSFTYGMGVNDEETFPALLQAAQQKYLIHNFAAPGYGTIHALIQLRQHIQSGHTPAIVLLGYTSLQDARNQLSGIQQKYWNETLAAVLQDKIEAIDFPYVRKKKGALSIHSKSILDFDDPWKPSQYSVLCYRLEMLFSNIYYSFNDKYLLTEMIVEEIQSLCLRHEIQFYLIALDQSNSLTKMKTFCQDKNINFIDAGIDIFDSELNLAPHDTHPNAKAHRQYAEKIKAAMPMIFPPVTNAEAQ